MLISEAFELYRLDVIIFRNQSPKTEETHRCALKVLLAFTEDIPVESLTFDLIRNWKIHLDKRREPSTVREYIIRLRVVLRHLQRRGYRVVDYDLISIPKRPQKVPEFLTKEQVAELLTAIGKPTRGYPRKARLRNTAIISLLYASGIRASELRQLDRANIRDDNTFTVIGKGSKARLCFLDDRTRQLIDAYLLVRTDSNPALFIADQTGRRLSKSGLQIIFARASRLVDFKTPVHPHVLRHSYATNLLRNNTNLRYVQEFLGHSSIQTTQMYTHVVNQDLRKVYNESHSY